MFLFICSFLVGVIFTSVLFIIFYSNKINNLAIKFSEEKMIKLYNNQLIKQDELINKVVKTTASQIQREIEMWANAYTN